ncbi:MAG: 4Fe-4S binding protein [Chloroflexota bacterium]
MKQLVILSGKGGTGKTSLSAAFAHLASEGPDSLRAVLADADVDAANLELVLHPERLETHDFTGGSVAVIDPQRCRACGVCEQACRFGAILPISLAKPGAGYMVNPLACEGCAACVYQCPEGAIEMQPQVAGQWHRSQSRYGPLFHAELFPAQENSGKLVTLVKQNARLCALDGGFEALLVDGPPGIGCPVIAAAAGAHLALIVTEPTAAGIHDLQRVLQTTAHFRVPTRVAINKADLYPDGVDQINALCDTINVSIAGQIPFDPAVGMAMMNGEPVTAYRPDAPASQAIRSVWQGLVGELR